MSAGIRDGDKAKPAATKVWDILPALSGTPDPERRRRLLLVLHVYIDDSGQTEPPVFVLAGYVARAERWAEFSDAWKAALAGPPALDYFKMHEAFKREGQFKGWTVEARDKRLRLLAGIIREHVLASVAVTVRHEDYRTALKGVVDPFLDRPYFVLYHTIMFRLLQWELENGIDEPVDFIFDEQMHDSDEVQAGFSKLLEALPPEMRKRFGQRPTHRNDKDVVPLQAADMLAWHVRRHHHAIAEGQDFDTAAVPVLEAIPSAVWNLTREQVSAFAVGLRQKSREHRKLLPYEVDFLEEHMDSFVGMMNQDAVKSAAPGDVVALRPIPASGMGRYLLVRSCECCGNPHLHRRSSGECLAGA
ncbi:MAG TPA: DUF3800 domain-containing protein [Falsiroseomonas sp.]|jgi:hypothetical protein|nr:DUF3800 domain-containing protein [Falsiroseomonas sp.]